MKCSLHSVVIFVTRYAKHWFRFNESGLALIRPSVGASSDFIIFLARSGRVRYKDGNSFEIELLILSSLQVMYSQVRLPRIIHQQRQKNKCIFVFV